MNKLSNHKGIGNIPDIEPDETDSPMWEELIADDIDDFEEGIEPVENPEPDIKDWEHGDRAQCVGADGKYEGIASMRFGNLKKRFRISVLIAVPVVLLSPANSFAGIYPYHFQGAVWALGLLSTLLFIYGGIPFFVGACSELKARKPAALTAVAALISLIYIYSLTVLILHRFTFPGRQPDYFWAMAIMLIMLQLGLCLILKERQARGKE